MTSFRPPHLLLLALLAFNLPAFAQKYRTAAGARISTELVGLTVQQKLFEFTTAELIGVASEKEMSATLLAEQHFKILGKRLNAYVGAGGHIGQLRDSGSFHGIDGILGIEYKINGLPLLLSYDLKPAYHLNRDGWVTMPHAVSVRFVFIKEKKPKRKGFFNRIFKKDEEEDD